MFLLFNIFFRFLYIYSVELVLCFDWVNNKINDCFHYEVARLGEARITLKLYLDL